MRIKIIGAGLGRTGTKSLQRALEQLINEKCFHMTELLQNPSRLKYLKKPEKVRMANWDNILEGYGATVDYPTCLYYKELMELNPDAKVILTFRDPEKWYESVRQTIYRGKPQGAGDVFRLIFNCIRSSDMRKVAPVFMHNDKIIWGEQFSGKFENKDYAIKVFNQHIEDIKRTVPPEKLLVYQVTEGWEPLCKFLGKPIPGIPFPHRHIRKNFNKKMDKLLVKGKLVMD